MSASLRVDLSPEQTAKLIQMAERLKTTPEDLARVGIEQLFTMSDEDFEQAIQYILKKNGELYRRLA